MFCAVRPIVMRLNSHRGEIAEAAANSTLSEQPEAPKMQMPPMASKWADFVDQPTTASRHGSHATHPNSPEVNADSDSEQFVTQLPARLPRAKTGGAQRGTKRGRNQPRAAGGEGSPPSGLPLQHSHAAHGAKSQAGAKSPAAWQQRPPKRAQHNQNAVSGSGVSIDTLGVPDGCGATEQQGGHGRATRVLPMPLEAGLLATSAPKDGELTDQQSEACALWAPVASDSAWSDFL